MDMRALARVGLVVFAFWADCAPRSAVAQPFCETCEVQVGLGGTYHYWGTTGSLVLPISVTWSENRYEFAAFRFTSQQLLPLPGTHEERHMADPYWGASLSRRWQVFQRGPVQGFVGFGVSLRTASDTLSVTRWDFASQLGLRFRPGGGRIVADLAMRHWSNGGIRLPNHGQDFATLTVRLKSGPFGIREADQIRIDPSLSIDRLLAAGNATPDQPLVP